MSAMQNNGNGHKDTQIQTKGQNTNERETKVLFQQICL